MSTHTLHVTLHRLNTRNQFARNKCIFLGEKTLGNPIRETICVYNSLKWFFIVETLLLFCEWENYLTPSVFNNLV